MRNKDELKQQAIIDATINLVNEIGFVACSVSKIAKKADVSPATLYVYYKNKEDLLVSTYIEIKQLFGRKLLNNFDDTLPIRDILKNLWFNIFMFTQKSPGYFQFTEQFSNSPFSELVDQEKVERNFEPIYQIAAMTGDVYIAFSDETDDSVVERFREALLKVKQSQKYHDSVQRYGL